MQWLSNGVNMTTTKLLSDIQTNYTSQYNSVQKSIIAAWLKKNEARIDLIFAETLQSFNPTSTKPLPGVYDFNEALKIVKKSRERVDMIPVNRVLLLDEGFLPRDKGAELLVEVFTPLCKKMNINFTEDENE